MYWSMFFVYFQAQTTAESSDVLSDIPNEVNEDNAIDIQPVQEYKTAVESLHNEGEDLDSLEKYKQSVAKLLGLDVGKT